MAFSTDNIGKNCYINISEDENIEDSLYGTIIGYYKNTDKNEEYYFVSINGNVKRIYDDSLVNIVDDGGGGSVTPGTLIMVSGEMTESQATQFRENIGAISIDDIGTVFVLKGSVDTVGDLPVSGNSVGDVYYVKEDSVEYIWLISDSHPNGYWEELGKAFDITVDSELSSTSTNPVQNKVINAALATKGTYSKPSGGIPKSDFASAVQTSLGKADTALQSVPIGYATETWVTNKGYQTAEQVRTAISNVRQLPEVSGNDNGKFLRVIDSTWAAATVPSAETTSF